MLKESFWAATCISMCISLVQNPCLCFSSSFKSHARVERIPDCRGEVGSTRVHQILEGTNEIMRLIVSRHLLTQADVETIQ